MNHSRLHPIAVFILLLPVIVIGQSRPLQKVSAPVRKTDAESVADAVAAERRGVAISLLNSLALEARSYRNEELRARVQARVADALWDEDAEGSRALFRRAWEAAEAFELQSQSASSSTTAVPGRFSSSRPTRPRSDLRAEILRLAARRDSALGEQFLAKLTNSRREQALPAAGRGNSKFSAVPLSAAEIAERLRLASELLEAGDVWRAVQFADPALTQVSMGSIQFLVALRDKHETVADQRFAALLSLAAADNASDANTVSLLTSYVFTPSTFLVVSDTGVPSSLRYQPHPAPGTRTIAAR